MTLQPQTARIVSPACRPAGVEAVILSASLLFFLWPLIVAADDREVPKPTRAAVIRFEGMIHPIREQYFYRKLDKAQSAGCDLVIVEIDSPGGFVEASLKLAERLRDLAWARTVAYIPREALSGAAIMALGCDEIVMAPNARIGDAGPIFQDENALFRHAPEKIRSNLVTVVRDLCERKGRPPALAEAMVDMDLEVYQVKNVQTGQETFMSEPEIESLADPENWQKGPPVQESRKGLFLEVTGRRAVDLQLAAATAESRQQLAARYGLRESDLVVFEADWVDTSVMILSSWPITMLLFIVGVIALYIELSAPGISIGGLIAALCFTLFFWSRFLGGTSGWLEVVLFLLGIGFLAVELFVLPGFGIAGVSGLLLLFASVIMAGQDFAVPHSGLQMRALLQSILVFTGSGCVAIVAVFFLSRYFGTIPLLNRLALHPPAAGEHGAAQGGAAAPAASYAGVRIGDSGVADSPLRPAGRARFAGNYVDVVTDGSFVDKGRPVRVIQISGNRVMVREAEEGSHGWQGRPTDV
jgi:membrane-bound serine protease (ClpP class)